MRVVRVPAAGAVSVVAGDRVSGEVPLDIVVSEVTGEVLLNDELISRHGLVPADLSEGLWRFRDESMLRRSEKPQRWL